MSMPGGPTTVAPGDIAELFLDYSVTDDGTGQGATVVVSAPSGWGDEWVALISDGKKQEIFFLPEGITVTKTAKYDKTLSNHVVSVFPMGDWDSDDDIDVRISQQDFESDKGTGITVDFPTLMYVPDDGAYGDLGQLSGWSLNGISRFATSRPGIIKTEAKIDVTIVNSGGTYTVTLSVGGVTIAQGSRVGNGVITLSAVNNSGVSGSVTIAYTANVTSGCFVIGRWAQKYTVTAGVVSTVVYDNGRATTLQARLTGLTPGNVNLSITPQSDTGVNSIGPSYTTVVNIPGRPEPPGAIAYVSGNWSNTVISVVASSTGSATYALYDVEALNGPTKVSEPAALKPAQVGTFNWALPSLSGAAAGKRRIVVAAVNGGTEDGTRDSITIEYDSAGNVVLPRPNQPAFSIHQPQPVTSGLVISVDFSYDSQNQAGVATKINLYLVAEGGAVPADGAVPTSQISLPTAVGGISRGIITATAPADGWYNVLVRAQTAAGTQSSNNNVTTDPVYASNTAPGAMTGVTVNVVT